MKIRRMRNGWVLAWTLVLTGLAASGSGADTVRLLAEAGVDGPAVTLADVAELDGALAEAMADAVVGAFGEGATELQVTLDAVRDALDQRHVNWGRVSLVGFAACRVHRSGAAIAPSPTDDAQDLRPDAATIAAANTGEPIDLDKPMTLGAAITRMLSERLGASRMDLQIDVPPRHHDLLRTSLLDGRWQIEPITSARLGLVPVLVRELDDAGRIIRSHPLRISIRRRVMGLVTTEAIPAGGTFTPQSVELKELWLDRDTDLPLTDRSALLDLVAAGPLGAGTPVYPAAVAQPLLVRRGDIVTVRAVVGDLVVTSLGRATQDAAMGETILLRAMQDRREFTATVTGRRQAMVGQLPASDAPAVAPEDEPVASASPTPTDADLDALARTVLRLQQRK